MSDRNEYTPWVELGMTELDYWKAMYLDIQVQWAPVIEAAKAMLRWEQGEGPRSDGGRVSDDLRNATLALQEARDE